MRRVLLTVTAMMLAVTACTGTASGPIDRARLLGGTFDPSRLTFAAALTPFSACDAVLAHFKAEALERVGPYGLDGMAYPFPFWARDAAMAAEGDSATTQAGSAPTSGVSYSDTNVQVAGVDEPDIVKTDGTRIISIVEGTLRYVVVTADGATLVGSLSLDEGWGHRLLVDGDRAFVFSTGFDMAVPIADSEVDSVDRIGIPWGAPRASVVEVDLSDPERMRVARTLTIDGSYLSARAVDGTVRMVISSHPSDLAFVYPSSPGAEQMALEANRRVVAESTIDDWLPSYTLSDASGATIASGLTVPCHRMHAPVEFSGFSTLSVLTLDLGAPLAGGSGTGVIASGDTVYASAESLYVVTNVWIPGDVIGTREAGDLGDRYSTSIHRFSIDGSGLAQYRSSGSVSGHLLDQFSLDEHDGVLRVAVTDGPPWGFDDRSESRVIVLEERDGALVEVGSVGGMGRGERIFSVRFMGDTAYVVTFRQVDPFYVVDLRDPTAPRVAGELKIDGYSAYLHPIGDHLVLGVGQDADSRGMTLGAKATIFDVSDPASPREVATWRAADTYSDVEWDHLAFLAWAPADIVVLPVQSWTHRFAGVVVLSTAGGLSEAGRVTHAVDEGDVDPGCETIEIEALGREVHVQVCDEDSPGGYPGHMCEPIPADELKYWGWDENSVPEVEIGPDERLEVCWPHPWAESPILRSLVIGETLWTLSSVALQGNALDGLEIVQRVDFGR